MASAADLDFNASSIWCTMGLSRCRFLGLSIGLCCIVIVPQLFERHRELEDGDVARLFGGLERGQLLLEGLAHLHVFCGARATRLSKSTQPVKTHQCEHSSIPTLS